MPKKIEDILKRIKTEKLVYRDMQFDRGTIDVENRTVDLAFSSETTEVERWYGIEILDHSAGAVNMERLNSGRMNALFNHDPDQLLGVIPAGTGIVGADRVGRCKVRFGRSAFADEKFQDVRDGILSSVSCGYMPDQMVLEESNQGKKPDVYRVTKWSPLEISLVTVPADASVGVGRSQGMRASKPECHSKDMEPMMKPEECTHGKDCSNVRCSGAEKAPRHISSKGERRTMDKCTICGAELQNGKCPACAEAERKMKLFYEQRMKEKLELHANIRALGKDHKCEDLAEKAVKEDWDMARFQHEVLTTRYDAKSAVVDTRGAGPLVGMTEKEIKRYSLARAIHEIGTTGRLEGLEKEASDEVAKIAGRKANGFYIPQDVTGRGGRIHLSERTLELLGPKTVQRMMATRALDIVPSTAGGITVDTEVLGSEMIELLRNLPLVAQLGARQLTGLVGNVLIPRVTGGATAYWLPPSGTVTASQQSFGQLALTPKRLVADTAYSKELVMQSSIDVESYVREDLMIILSIAQDLAALNGLGANGQPVGIINTTGIKTETFGAAATWAKIVDMETQVAAANALVKGANCAYLTTPITRGKWKTATKIASSQYSAFLWDTGENGSGSVNGYRAEATMQVPSDRVIFGNWYDLILASWAGIDVVVDPYSLKKSGQIEVTITLWTDVGVRHPVSFCVSTDSGAQ